jgi:hypothetical protein
MDNLEELAERFGVKIRYEAKEEEEGRYILVGGMCLLRGDYVLIINSRATTMNRINTLATPVKDFDLSIRFTYCLLLGKYWIGSLSKDPSASMVNIG